MTASPEAIKACCATAYASPVARWLLGTSFHPGGAALTRRLIRFLGVGPGDTVADVACGPGESSLQLAREAGCRVFGIDLSSESIEAAWRAAEETGLAASVSFVVGDAEALPLEDASVDGVLCECSLCTFPDKRAAAAELSRVLKPGGRLALSDMTADPAKLPASLRTLEAWIACLADARPLPALVELLRGAGLVVEIVERHDDALARFLDHVEARLRLARVALAHGGDPALVDRGLDLVAVARESLERGFLGYAVLAARRPAGRVEATAGPVGASNFV
ncbi:MAG: class I SAM-dependent methyltransferase [Candidatus Limnocylindria bacterium]